MAFRQQQRPQSSRQISFHAPEPVAELATTSTQLKRPLDQSEEWILFSPTAPSTTARTQTTSTERTPRTAGLSRFSEFGSLDTAAQSEQDEDAGTFFGTEEELDSLDEGLHAFHEPSEYGVPTSRLQQSGETVLPTHDGLGEFQPDATIQEHMWQFERPRRRTVRRRSSVQRHFTILDEADELNQEQDRRQRIEKWRLDQSKALLEEIEKETRRRRRMSMVSAARSRTDSMKQETRPAVSRVAPSVTDAQSDSSEEGAENMSFWQRITRRVIRDLIGLDEDTLSVIFGESLPEDANTPKPGLPIEFSADKALQEAGIDTSTFSEDGWQTRLLERVAQELGTLVHQLSEHPGAFSTYQRTQGIPDYAGLTSVRSNTAPATDLSASRPMSSQPTTDSPSSAHFAPTFPAQQTSHTYNEASLWGIEEEPAEVDPLDSFRTPPAPTANIAEDLVRERAYWERDLDVKMIFNFLVKRFTSSRSAIPALPRRSSSSPVAAAEEDVSSARRAAIIRQHHPLVNRTTDAALPTSSASNIREAKRKDVTYRSYYSPQASRKLRSNSSCASQSTKKSKRSGSSTRNYWDLGGSVGSVAGEV
ncbi:hypothetical protein CC86DRAFT_100291 [Ophiobolus disseminans]|uniref:Uncharacterized protein n=1 Tax=Ophiobolus disseminans TaxID=1469910 RepID=A0A6A6ZL17_9PLEO|nr:hypothetical protein CC86DRAFT_100291 [Ophiobolus disseminans]